MKTVKPYSTIFISIFAVLAFSLPAFAQNVISSPTVNVSACANITSTLSYGKYDATTNGQVSILQNFLHQKGYLVVTPTGYFGPLTFRAVKAFQLKSASGAVDGIVGPQTQAHIRAMDCMTGTVTAPTILSLSPTSGPSGTVVTVTGSNFTPTGNIVHFAIGGIANISSLVIPVASNSPMMEQLSFTVPSSIGPYCKPDQACPLYLAILNAGTYPVSIENSNGISTPVNFTVIGNSTIIPTVQ